MSLWLPNRAGRWQTPRSLRDVRALVGAGVGTVILALSVGVGVACSVPDPDRVTTVLAPDETEYKQYVDPYLAKRCATLDCHGQVGRPLRLYSQLGLREADAGIIDPVDVTGFHGKPTTDQEKHANYQAVVGLQPEVMSQVIGELGFDPERLLLLLKPLNTIPHKGGPVMGSGDTGYNCFVEWLEGGQVGNTYDFAGNCTNAASAP